MAKHRPRKPRPARGLPPRDPVYDAETERIRRELEADCIRLDALLIEKQAERLKTSHLSHPGQNKVGRGKPSIHAG